MLKKYNFCAELMVLAKSYLKQGKKVEAAKLAYKALAEEDADELIESLDEINQDLDPMAEEEVAEEEIPSEDDMFETVVEEDEAPVEEEIAVEPEVEEIEEVEAEEEIEELPEVEEVLCKLAAKKTTLANLASISGKTASRQKAIKTYLK